MKHLQIPVQCIEPMRLTPVKHALLTVLYWK